MLKNLEKYTLILASGSPRRQQFFLDLDLKFEIRLKEIDEVYPTHLKAEEITNYLSELKANAFDGELAKNEILITSDTIVWHQNKALGKPKNETDAIAMLQSMSGQTHDVITSVTFKTDLKINTLFEITKVTFSPISEEEITYYISKYKPLDKAGSYGIQEWIGLIAISKIEGSYTNVVGLPTEKVFNYLKNI
jgi:septum formation protein